MIATHFLWHKYGINKDSFYTKPPIFGHFFCYDNSLLLILLTILIDIINSQARLWASNRIITLRILLALTNNHLIEEILCKSKY